MDITKTHVTTGNTIRGASAWRQSLGPSVNTLERRLWKASGYVNTMTKARPNLAMSAALSFVSKLFKISPWVALPNSR